MNHSLASFFRKPPMISIRSVSSQLFALAFTTKFSKKDVRSFLTLSAKDLDVMIGLPHLNYPLIIHSATCLSFFRIGSFISSLTFTFCQNLGHQIFLLSDFSLLLLSSSSPSGLL